MKNYSILVISVASFISGLYFLVMYFTVEEFSRYTKEYVKEYYAENLLFSAISFIAFLSTAFYLWKKDFLKKD